VEQVSRIGMDTSKHIFQLHGVDAAERPVLRRKLRRRDMIAFFERLSPTRVAIEACGASHHWARLLRGFGHEIQLIAPQLVKPYVKRGKNDAADAEALCEAMSRPTMRFVPVKSAEQQAALMLVGLRDRLVRNRTQLANAIRSYAAEFGITGATGLAHVPALLRASRPTRPCRLWPASCSRCTRPSTSRCKPKSRLSRSSFWPGTGPMSAAGAWRRSPAWGRSGRRC
jgi:transposase